MFCTHCGAEMPATARFCARCGGATSQASAQTGPWAPPPRRCIFFQRVPQLLALPFGFVTADSPSCLRP